MDSSPHLVATDMGMQAGRPFCLIKENDLSSREERPDRLDLARVPTHPIPGLLPPFVTFERTFTRDRGRPFDIIEQGLGMNPQGSTLENQVFMDDLATTKPDSSLPFEFPDCM
jgi:hypothetical protein